MADTEKLEKQEVVKNILDGRREFVFEDGDNITTYFIADPSGAEIRKADWHYAKVFNEALADGLPTEAQMLDILTQRGLLSEEYTKQLEKVKLDLAAALFRLENSSAETTDEEQEDLALEVSRLRDELLRLNHKINGPLGNTCENLATDARNEYMTSRIVEKKDGSKLWETFDDYLNEENNALVLKCRFEVMAWLNGLDSDFLEKMPEQVALQRLGEKRLQETLDAARKKLQEASDEDAEEKPEEERPEEKKPRTRKPRAKKKVVEDLELPQDAVEKPKRKPGRPRKKPVSKED